MKEQAYLAGLSRYGGKSLREIAEESGRNFRTVKKYVDCEDWNEGKKPRKKRKEGLEPLKETIDEWLREDQKRNRKYRRTGTKIYNDLTKDEELSKKLVVGKQTVINYVSKRKKEMYKKNNKTAMYGLHSIGEAQVDFGEILVETRGSAEEKWNELVVSFPWSNAGFMQVCRYETKECLCEGLQRIFEGIGGIPQRILFDNMSSAVVHIEEYGERKQTEMFMRFTMHHGFKAEFCNPDSPQEKGNVENKVGYLRRNYLLPPPKIENQADMDKLNRQLMEECKKDMEREHYIKQEKISELFKEEQKSLIPMPREPFRVFKLEKAQTDGYSFIRYDNNRYSTSPEYPNSEVWLEISTTEIRVLNESYRQIAAHKRKHTKEMMPQIDFENYVSTLARKPRAFLSSPYFTTLPKSIQEHLKSSKYKELKKMLLTLVPIIREGRIGDASAVIELTEIRNTDDFITAYKALTEEPSRAESVTTAQTPPQE
jgi:transposase